jgi:hypothetical protein
MRDAKIGGDLGYGRAFGVAVQLDCVPAELFGVIFGSIAMNVDRLMCGMGVRG